MNAAVRKAGLASARQVKTGDWSKVQDFLGTLRPLTPHASTNHERAGSSEMAGSSGNTPPSPNNEDNSKSNLGGMKSIVKPARGCASGSVFLCTGEREAKEAFEKIRGTPKYGTPGAVNDEVMTGDTKDNYRNLITTHASGIRGRAPTVFTPDRKLHGSA